MKIQRLVLTASLFMIPVLGVRAEEAKPVKAKPVLKADRPETELEKVMSKIGKAWRQVRKANRDGTLSPATAEIVAGIRANAVEASKLKPALEAERPVAEQAKFQADYEAQMKKLVATLTALETALKAGDNTVATKLVGEVGDLMKSGHHDFRKPEEH